MSVGQGTLLTGVITDSSSICGSPPCSGLSKDNVGECSESQGEVAAAMKICGLWKRSRDLEEEVEGVKWRKEGRGDAAEENNARSGRRREPTPGTSIWISN